MRKNKMVLGHAFVIFFCNIIWLTNIYAQEIHFSQFYANPLTANPAHTAFYNGNVRANAMYRTQWRAIDSKPYQTISVSAEKQFHFYDHTYGFGIQALRDESGYVGLVNEKLLISSAFAFHVNGHKLSGGLQLGLVYKTTAMLDYTYDQQFELGGDAVFNRLLASGELEGSQLFHAAVNAGVAWEKQLTYNYVAKAGISMFNLNTPYETLTGVELENSKQNMRIALQFGGVVRVNNKLNVEPNILYMCQEKSTDFLVGGNVNYALQSDVTLYGGTLFRYGLSKNYDASVWIVGMKFKRFDVGVSYDINVSSLREATNYRGAFEISLTYLSPSWKSTNIKIPCERI